MKFLNLIDILCVCSRSPCSWETHAQVVSGEKSGNLKRCNVFMERQKIRNSRHGTEGQEPSSGTDTT